MQTVCEVLHGSRPIPFRLIDNIASTLCTLIDPCLLRRLVHYIYPTIVAPPPPDPPGALHPIRAGALSSEIPFGLRLHRCRPCGTFVDAQLLLRHAKASAHGYSGYHAAFSRVTCLIREGTSLPRTAIEAELRRDHIVSICGTKCGLGSYVFLCSVSWDVKVFYFFVASSSLSPQVLPTCTRTWHEPMKQKSSPQAGRSSSPIPMNGSL